MNVVIKEFKYQDSTIKPIALYESPPKLEKYLESVGMIWWCTAMSANVFVLHTY